MEKEEALGMVPAYLLEVGKDTDGLLDTRLLPNGNGWDVELVFGDEWVTYTRVAKFYHNGTHKSVTQKTRLWVPFSEVPTGAAFYADGNWHTKTGRCNIKPWLYVEVPFYYSKGEGAIAGNVLWVPEDLFDSEQLDSLVHGCKFTLWATCYNITHNTPSVFTEY